MTDTSGKGIPFKEFLDKSTNLITIFGVLNALIIYSATLDNKSAQSFLLPSLFLLSLLTWFELILFALRSSNESIKYEIFYFLACTVQLGLVWYFVTAFSGLVLLVVIFMVWMGLTFLVGQGLVRLFASLMVTRSQQIRKLFVLLIFITSLIISGLLIRICLPLLKPLIDEIPFERSIIK